MAFGQFLTPPWELDPQSEGLRELMGALATSAQAGPAQAPQSYNERALKEGAAINRLLAHVAAARSGARPTPSDKHIGAQRTASPIMQAIGGNAPTTLDGMGVADIVRSAEGTGEVPVDFYRDRLPADMRDPRLVEQLAYGLPTPSNGESREQAAARMLRMRNGYVNGQPVPQGPQADAIRAQFYARQGERSPQSTADLAAIDQRTQQYADAIRGHGGTQDFSTYAAQQSGLPIEDVQQMNRRMATMSPSDRSIMALAGQRKAAAASPVAQAVGMGGRGGAQGEVGAAGPAGAAGMANPAGMTPEQAMARLMERRGGQYFPGQGYVTQPMMDEHVNPAVGGAIPEEKIIAGLARAGAGSAGVSGISPEFRKELDARKAAVVERGKTRRSLPGSMTGDPMAMNFLRQNPEIVTALIGAASQEGDRALTREENAARMALAERALGLQEKEAAAAAPMPAPGVLPAGAAPDPRGMLFTPEESAALTGMPPARIAQYGREQGWDDEKIINAIRDPKYGNNSQGTIAQPDTWGDTFNPRWLRDLNRWMND